MRRRINSGLIRYSLALVAVTLTTLGKWHFYATIGPDSPFLLFALPVALSTWWGGIGPGLLATLFGSLAVNYFFLPPLGWTGLTGQQGIMLLIYFGECSGLILLIEATHRAELRRQQAEAGRSESEARLRLLVETAPIMLWLTETNQPWAYVNQAWQKFTGRTPAQEAGQGWLEAVHSEDRGQCQQTIQAALATYQPFTLEYRLRRFDGEYRWLLMTGVPRQSATAGAAGYLATAIDMTEHRLIEEALREREELFRAFMDNSSFIAFMKDEAGHLLYVNQPFARHYQLNQADWLGKTEAELWPSAAAHLREHDQQVLAGQQAGEFIETIPAPDGRERVWLTSKFPFRTAAGRQLVASVACDITDRMRMEDELRQLSERLDQKVQERTAQLEEVNKELELFAYSVSHDLRMPLRFIRGLLGKVLDQPPETLLKTAQAHLQVIADTINHLAALTEGLLSFSQVGRSDLRLTSVPLNSLVQTVIQELPPEFIGRPIQWRIGPLPTVPGDAALLRVVLQNLLANSIKFSRLRPESQIEVGAIESETEFICFVRDNGVGFDMKYVKKLFGVFQRLHSAEEFEGTGLGLANIQRIIHRHGGRVWAQGAINQGATFYFSLPKPEQRLQPNGPNDSQPYPRSA